MPNQSDTFLNINAFKQSKMNKDYNWFLEHDLSKYSGKWIAIHNSQVVESDNDILKLNSKLEKRNLTKAFVTKIANDFRVL